MGGRRTFSWRDWVIEKGCSKAVRDVCEDVMARIAEPYVAKTRREKLRPGKRGERERMCN